MTDQTTPEPHDYLAAVQAEYNAKPLPERLLNYFDESDMECLPPVILETLAKLAAAEQARDEARAERDELVTETLRLGISLAETIHERHQLRTQLAASEQTRRAALDVAADLTAERDSARADITRLQELKCAACGSRVAYLNRAGDIIGWGCADGEQCKPDPAERVETTTHADPEPHGLAAIRDRVKSDTILTEAEIDGASSGWIELMQARRDRAELLSALDTELDEQTRPAPLTLAQAAGHLHDWAGDLADGTRTDWPAGHPDIIRGIRAAADWLDARDKYETETREQHLTALCEAGRRLGESLQQLGEAIREGAKARAARETETPIDEDDDTTE